jgi:transposase
VSILKKIGLKRLKTAQIPAKADTLAQKEFLETKLEPKIEEARQGKCELLFVDASHFVLSAFLGYLWCFTRIFIKSPSGRQRYNVLGAFNAISHKLFTLTNDKYINANSIITLMKELLKTYTDTVICLVMDNARYQRCKLVMDFAKEHNIELLFLPPYSPNLNLIERLWRFVKKKCLYNKYYADFSSFTAGIDNCIAKTDSDYKKDIYSLMTLKFQVLKNVS